MCHSNETFVRSRKPAHRREARPEQPQQQRRKAAPAGKAWQRTDKRAMLADHYAEAY